jgi:NADP-dependent 3-hydroxy acid dehydrogenase YdfG
MIINQKTKIYFMSDIQDKVVIIPDISSGIGEASAKVVLAARREEFKETPRRDTKRWWQSYL